MVGEAEIRVLSGNLTGGLRGDALLAGSNTRFGGEEAHDPTHIPLHELTGGLDIDGNPSNSEPIIVSDESNEKFEVKYYLPFTEKTGFVISDLVWGKVKDYPWWPGLIIDSSDASKLAIKYQKKNTLLVAYFGDNTFAWCEESQLKPFFQNFSNFQRQANLQPFNKAVAIALTEVSRRFEVGTICPCLDKNLLVKSLYPKIENSGVKERFSYYPVDKGEIVNYFDPKGLVGFIRDLALVPSKGDVDKLGLVMACSQINTLKAFYQTKGYSQISDKKKRGRPFGSKSMNKPRKTTRIENGSSPLSPKYQKIILENESINRPVIVPVEEKRSDECDPTALLLTFGTRSGTLPSEMDLKRIFSRYGAWKGEMEKEKEGCVSKVKIVFKKRADADMAFGSLRKQNVFGHALLSYRLLGLDELAKKSPVRNGGEPMNSKLHAPKDTRVQSDDNVDEISVAPSSPVQSKSVAENSAEALKPVQGVADTLEMSNDPSSPVHSKSPCAISVDASKTVQIFSSVWRVVEELEVFRLIPQKPHFKQLESYCKEVREGKSVGLMVTYASLADSVRQISFDDDMAVFEQRISCFDELKDNGFDIDPIRTRLDDLIQIKEGLAGPISKRVELEKEVAELEMENESVEKLSRELVKVVEEIRQLKERYDKTRAKLDEYLVQSVGNGQEISRLREEISAEDKLRESACGQFQRLLAAPL